MNSAAKQHPRSLSRLLGQWATLAALLLAALPSPGQVTLQSGPITIVDATLDNTAPPPQPSIPSPSAPFGAGAAAVTLGDTHNGKTVAGKIQKIAVTLSGLTHSYISDLDVLLVGPGAKSVMLMSDVGVGMAANSSEITITGTPAGGSAAGAFPASGLPGANLSGTFRPADFEPGESLKNPASASSTQALAPAGPYGTSLDVFNGDSGKGTWQLFVNDDRRVDAGEIRQWAVKLWYAPVITSVTATNTNEDTPITLAVKIVDLDNDILASGYSVTAVSSDVNLVENTTGALAVTKPASGDTYLLRVTPKANANGTVTITVRVNDGTTTESFPIALTINALNDAPTLGDVKFGGTTTNVVRAIQGQLSPAYTVAVADIDSALSGVTVFGQSSSDTNVVLGGDVFFVPGQTGDTRTFYVAPKGNAVGSANLNLVAVDSFPSNSLPRSTPLSVAAATDRKVFANFAPIEIAATANATNSATIAVSGIADALISKVTLTLANVSHTRPEDLDVWLVGPGNTKVLLMTQAGGNNPIVNGRLVFDSAAISPIPDNSALIPTGLFQATYRPADYAGATTPDLGAFNNSNPNGNWIVVVVDRVAGEQGTIASGAILSIWTAPVIGAISDRTVNEDSGPLDITFSVSDLDGQVHTVDAGSSDTSKAGAVALTYPTNAPTAVVRVTPVANAFGSTTITVTAKDNSGYTVQRSFTFTITSVNDQPTISPISKQLTYVGKPVPDVEFTIGDIETAAAGLTVTATSSNRSLLPDDNISVVGSGATRTLRMFPTGLTGNDFTDVTVRVTDADGGTAQTTFRVDVLPKASPLFANTEAIQFRDSGIGGPASAAFPAPSVITVSGLVGVVSRVTVNLSGLEHPNPNDLDVLLVGPGGQKVLLMSDAGGTDDVTNLQLAFDGSATSPLPVGTKLSSGSYLPTDYNGGDLDVFIATSGTSPTTAGAGPLSIFNGTTANGEWKLYVMDDTGNSAGDDKVGVIARGWQLLVETVPVLSEISDLTTREDEQIRTTIDLGDDQPGLPTVFTVTSDNESLIKASKVTFTDGGDLRTMSITPELNASGVANMTLRVTVGGQLSNQRSFKVTVTAVNDAPTIAGLAELPSVPVGLILGPVGFTVSDVEEANPAVLTVTATSLDAALPSSNLILGGSGGSRTLTILPPSGRDAISAAIDLVVSDPQGAKTTNRYTYASNARISSVFTETGRIAIDDNSQARPYPSIINVSGVSGLVNRVRVTLNGLTHAFPDDVNVLLVKGTKAVVLMANAGGGAPTNSVTELTLGFDQSAATSIPDETKLAHGSFKPARYGAAQTAPNAAANSIPSDISESLEAFNGIDPNGEWRLFVWDDTRTDAGEISRGWSVAINTGPRIVSVTAGGRSSPLLGTEDVVLPVTIELSDSDTPSTNVTLTAEVVGDTTIINNSSLSFDTATAGLFTRVFERAEPHEHGRHRHQPRAVDGERHDVDRHRRVPRLLHLRRRRTDADSGDQRGHDQRGHDDQRRSDDLRCGFHAGPHQRGDHVQQHLVAADANLCRADGPGDRLHGHDHGHQQAGGQSVRPIGGDRLDQG
jgi:subtilisin-like proprotein convertase family protein